MIIIIHLICSIIQNIIRKLREKKPPQKNFYLRLENDNSLGIDLRIYYEQRYRAVERILLDNKWKGKIKKVADFGCAEMEFFLYLKNIHHLEEVFEIDIDENLLRDNLFKVQPLISDYIFKRSTPLTVHVLNGSIGNPFIKLIGADAVIAIEVIEHLHPDALDALPYNIFYFIKPKIAIFTTPNADFKMSVPFARGTWKNNRKFEWTRKQFQSWAKNIVVRFPDYSVHFSRIGDGSNDTETVGFSQMAVFSNTVKMNSSEDNTLHRERFDLRNNFCACEKCLLSTSFGICTHGSSINPFLNYFKLWWYIEDNFATYKLIETIKFPFREHRLSFLDRLDGDKDLKGSVSENLNNDKKNREIFLNKYFFVKRCSVKPAVADRQTLDGAHYEIEQCTVSDELQNCVVTEMESDISTPNNTTSSTTNNENANKSYSEWTTIAEDDESDWDTDNNTQRSSSWTDISESSRSEAVESAGTVVDCLINNVNNCVNQNLNKDVKLSDSGYAKSNTIETTSTRSCSDAADGNSLDDFYSSSSNEEESKNDVNPTKVAKITDKEKNSVQILHNKQLIPISKSTIAHFEVTTKICKNSPSRDAAGSSLPSTSNGRKKKRPKKFDSEEDSSGGSPPKLLEKQEHNEEYGSRSPSGGEYEEILESEAMLVDNDGLDGNDYLNSQFNNEEPIDETNSENVALLQSEAAAENDAIKNLNEELNDPEVNVINAVELASREALFDPNSQVSLLDDFNISNVPYENLDLDGNDNADRNIIFHGVNIRTSNEDLALPISIHPFPNWLLRMLIVDEGVEDAEAHDEPHFYCQGDGLGVHPSFANEDVDDDTSSDSSLAVSTNDEAEAEPSESEIEVGSLPFDTTSETARQDQLRLEIPESAIESPPLPDASVTFSAGTSSGTESTDEYFDTVEVTESTNNVKPSNKNCKE